MHIYDERAQRMIRIQLQKRGIHNQQVLNAMREVPRHEFIPQSYIDRAYNDGPLPIGRQQTISQPYMVALMTEQLELTGTERVLEIGSGSGYQTAILANLVKHVYSMERIAELANQARENLTRLGYTNVTVTNGDGYLGWEEHAPFDRVIVTAGAPYIPKPLIKQLVIGGIAVIPVGESGLQRLLKITRIAQEPITEEILSCVFVPLLKGTE
jgi:protein-L-isoaspartate(D-aspartate) O-methyltransferase